MQNPGGYDPIGQLRQEIAQMRGEVAQQQNRFAGYVRQELDKNAKVLSDLATIANAMRMQRSGGPGGLVRVEDVPGRRVPFVLLMDIPIGANTTSIKEQSVTISQEGPFVAVKRFATFQSSLEFQVTDPNTGAQSRFSGRSFGRYRPISSAWDILDAQASGIVTTANPLANGVTVGTVGLPNSQSGFRSMQFDGRITVRNAGSSYPRQNISVPSSLWTTSINSPVELGALDFFERGEIITIQVESNHINNPPAGNVNGTNIFGTAGYPFEAGQYDVTEGILTPSGLSVAASVVTHLATDVITRLPDGILTIGYEGYRIIQPVSPVP